MGFATPYVGSAGGVPHAAGAQLVTRQEIEGREGHPLLHCKVTVTGKGGVGGGEGDEANGGGNRENGTWELG